MVRPCCKNVCKKYILKDGKIDPKNFKKVFGFCASFDYRKEKILDEEIEVPYLKNFFSESKICMCICHQHDLNIVH